MKKRIWVLAITLLVVIPAISGIVAASGESSMEKHHEMEHMVGEFQYDNGKVIGEYVNFTINPKTGEIANYSVDNSTVFSMITYENTGVGKVSVSGARFRYTGVWGSFHWNKKNMNVTGGWRVIQSLDSPVGILHMVVHGKDMITYTLSSGINATLQNSTVVLTGKIYGYLIVSNGKVAINGNEIMVNTTQSESEFMTHHGEKMLRSTSILFIEPQHWNMPKQVEREIMKGLEKNKVGGEMYISREKCEFINYTYGMQAKLMLKERNHIRMEVSGNGIDGGRVMLINIENNSFNYTKHSKLVVKLDGKEITETSVSDVMDGGSQAKYAVQENGNMLTVMVYIPHFSEHVLDIESESSDNGSISNLLENPLMVALGIVILIAIVGVVIWRVKSR